MNALYRWIVFNSVGAFIVAYLISYHDILHWITTNDPTRISLIIAGVYVLSSAYLGLGILRKKVSVPLLKHIANSVMGLGLIGTVLATYWLFKDIAGVSDTKQMIWIVLKGLGTSQITTLFGLSAAWLLDQQRVLTIGLKDD